MRKFEQVRDIETIKRMAIAGWPILINGIEIMGCNNLYVCNRVGFASDWANLTFDNLHICDPEITLAEARERITSGVVYCRDNLRGRFTRVIALEQSSIMIDASPGHCENIFPIDRSFYPFNPSQFSDLLEEVEEEKAYERPELLHLTGNYEDDSNYLNGHLELIYSELDDIKKSIKSIHDNDFESVLITRSLTARIEALEGKI